jgi:2-polyprenyl-3-methyl-5-hydroxy-6-metoxy-1,4-benzoquinol methylase
VRFYVDMARDRGSQVLDLACGSGRIAIPLAEAGKQVVGGNLSPEMLQRAQLATEARDLKAEFVRLDMRDFDLGGRLFDTIMVAANSVLHLHSFDDFMDFFRCVVRICQ